LKSDEEKERKGREGKGRARRGRDELQNEEYGTVRLEER
jgi:hypothetical protein